MYCASRAGSKVIESLMSMPSTSVPPLARRMHPVRQSRRQRRAADAQQAHHITPADPANLPHGSPPLLIVFWRIIPSGAQAIQLGATQSMRYAAGPREESHRVLRYIASRLRDCCGDGAAGHADHLPDRQHRAGRSGADAAWRHRRQQPGDRRGLPAQMGPRPADVGPLLDVPARPDAWRSRHLDLLAAPGDRGHRAIRARNDRAVHRRVRAVADLRPAARRGRGDEARFVDRPCRARASR